MGGNEARWAEIAALDEGDLRHVPYPALLAALARAGRTAVLELTRRPIEKRIVLVDGAPVECRSNLAHETFGRFLVASGQLEPGDFRDTLSESLARSVPLGEILLERGLMTAEEVYRQLKQNLARKLLDGFTWQRGRFRLLAEADGEASTVRVNVARLIVTGVLKLTPQAEVERFARELPAEPLAAHPEPPLGAPAVAGGPAKVLSALAAGPAPADELAKRTELEPGDLDRVLYALHLTGAVVPAGEAPSRPTADPAAGERSAEEAPPADEELLRWQSKILEAYLCFRRKDAFDLLHIAEEAGPEEIEAAYLEAARTYAPWALEELGETDYAGMARILFLAAAEAFGELRDPERRGTLLHRRSVLREEQAAKEADLKIETDLLDPELQYRKGLEIRAQGDLRRALEFFEFAADCDPQNAVYRSEAAYCRYQLSPGLHREETLSELRAAARIDRKCGLPLYYLGRVLGEEGRLEAAEEALRRSIKPMAPDRRPIDALRKLKGKKGRR